MRRGGTDTIAIKKSKLFYVIVAIAFFLVGFFGSGTIKSRVTDQRVTDNCRKFCEFIPDTEFSHVDADRHCYCTQKDQMIFDRLLNKTLTYTKTVDVGIITDVEIENSIDQG